MSRTFDQMSLLHLAAGIVAYFWGLPLLWWFLIHALFEYVENTKFGVSFINKYMSFWPGARNFKKESFMNSMIGDNVSAVAGWVIASSIDKWYQGEKLFPLTKRTGNTKFKDISS